MEGFFPGWHGSPSRSIARSSRNSLVPREWEGDIANRSAEGGVAENFSTHGRFVCFILWFDQAMKTNARNTFLAFFRCLCEQLLDLLHQVGTECSRHNVLLTVRANGNGREDGHGVIVMERADDVFADLLFSRLDRSHKLGQLTCIDFADDLANTNGRWVGIFRFLFFAHQRLGKNWK